MQKLWKCQAVLLAVIGLTAYGVEPAAEIEITSFSISPVRIRAGEKISLRWRVRNAGTIPLNVQPLVQFVKGQQSYTVEATELPQRIDPSEEADFSAIAHPPFRQGGEYFVWVSVRDFDAKAPGCGFIYERKMVVEDLGKPVAKPRKSAEPTIMAEAQRPLYFVGEAVSISGRVADAKTKVKFISVFGTKYPVKPNGRFKFELPASRPGRQKVVLEAEDMPSATVEFVVTPDELAFSRLFGTDRTYEAGIFSGVQGDKMVMLPQWSARLGVSFVAQQPYNGLRYSATMDEMMTRADRFGVTLALVGSNDCTGGEPFTLQADGKKHQQYTNLLAVRYRQMLLERFTRLALLTRHHGSFKYLLLMPEWFKFEMHLGYDVENLERFAEEVLRLRPGVELPPFKDPKAWHELINGDKQLRELWIMWREGTWTDYMVRLQDALKAAKPDLILGTCESNFMGRGFWNRGMLVDRGIDAHAPHTNFPNADPYMYTDLAAGDRREYGYDSVFLSLSIWEDVTCEPEQIVGGLFGIIRAGGTRVPAWSDGGPRFKWKELDVEFGKGLIRTIDQYAKMTVIDGALQSPITDMITGVSGHRKARAMERAAAQISQLPYKDRFNLYDRQGGELPLRFAVHWNEGDQEMRITSRRGRSTGDRFAAVYAFVQDLQPNGYVEMILFNGVRQNNRVKNQRAIFRTDDGYTRKVYTFDHASLRERELTVTTSGAADLVPFVDGAPWLHYQRKGNKLIVKSIPFEAQHVRLLQLVRAGRKLPHVTDTSARISQTMLNVEKRQLWLRLAQPQAADLTVRCADWGLPRSVDGGELMDSYGELPEARISVPKTSRSVTIWW